MSLHAYIGQIVFDLLRFAQFEAGRIVYIGCERYGRFGLIVLLLIGSGRGDYEAHIDSI